MDNYANLRYFYPMIEKMGLFFNEAVFPGFTKEFVLRPLQPILNPSGIIRP